MSLEKLRNDLQKAKNKEKSLIYQKFFKTGKGEYGEGDVFLGLTVPQSRKIALKYSDLSKKEISSLFQSKIHEERLIALLILVNNYKNNKEDIVNYYLSSSKYINNWDLVDLSADKILGAFLLDKEKSILYKLAQSSNIWERRIAIISTFHFIKNNQFEETTKISEILLKDNHDLIHKAVGWMLREMGKRDIKILESFLKSNYKNMSRTTLRYAIERFPEETRKKYLRGKI